MEGFNWITYKKLNLDLQQVGLKTKQEFEKHWIDYGKAEGRKCSIDLNKEYPLKFWLLALPRFPGSRNSFLSYQILVDY